MAQRSDPRHHGRMTHGGTPPLPPPPPLSDQRAYVPDADGPLAPLANLPGPVRVDSPVGDRQAELPRRLGGTLAPVSGRRIETLGALFAALRFAAAGLHGLQRRRAGEEPPPPAAPPAALEAIKAQAAALLRERYPDALLEDKGEAIALHWRLMP